MAINLPLQISRERLYILLAFGAGIVLTLGYKDVYPDLELHFRRAMQRLRLRSHSLLSLSPPASPSPVAEDVYPAIQLNDHTSSSRSKIPFSDDPRMTQGIKDGIEGTIGNTPLIRIKSLSEATGCDILAKAEYLNGAGNSPKDRVALHMIRTAEAQGLLTPHSGDVVYEGTVGSTGISLAAICRARGYLAHICMPSDQSTEKSNLLLKLGAKVERVPPASIIDTNQFVNVARRRATEHTLDTDRQGRGYFADQFENHANFTAHYESTGPEIYRQLMAADATADATAGTNNDGKSGAMDEDGEKKTRNHAKPRKLLDAFVAGAGTGGTISGVAMYLKPRIKDLRIVLADPMGSGLLNKIKNGVMFADTEREGTRRRHQVDSIVEGIGTNRLTANFSAGMDLIDDAIRVTDEQAIKMARWLVEKDGIFIGSSSAVNCTAATKLALQLGPGHRIVTILCDSGARHLSKFWAKAGDVGADKSLSLDQVLE